MLTAKTEPHLLWQLGCYHGVRRRYRAFPRRAEFSRLLLARMHKKASFARVTGKCIWTDSGLCEQASLDCTLVLTKPVLLPNLGLKHAAKDILSVALSQPSTRARSECSRLLDGYSSGFCKSTIWRTRSQLSHETSTTEAQSSANDFWFQLLLDWNIVVGRRQRRGSTTSRRRATTIRGEAKKT